MDAVQERLDRLYRAMKGQHVLYPEYVPLAHDPWRIDLRQPVPAWWDRYRLYNFGPLRMTVEVSGGPEHRVPCERVFEIVEWLGQRQALPRLALCGSQSPLSPKYPYERSDVDFVCFISFDELFSDIDYWCSTKQRVKSELMPQCSAAFGLNVDCGFLLEEFRSFPFMMDAADVVGSNAREQWTWSVEQVVTTLEQRWEHFVTHQHEVQRECERLMATLQHFIGQESVVQVVAEVPWKDVIWWAQTPYWKTLFGLGT